MSRGVSLRPHHLLCVQKFAGEGYSEEFVENMAAVVGRIQRGAPAEIVDGRDDICAACNEECDEERVRQRDEAVLKALQEESFAAAVALPEEERMRVCAGCDWFELCYGAQ